MNRTTIYSLIFGVICTSSALGRDDLADCLAGAQRFERRYERLAASIAIDRFWLKAFDVTTSIPADRKFLSSRTEFWRDRDCARLSNRENHRSQLNGRLSEFETSSECLVTPELRVRVPCDPATGQFEGTNLTAAFADIEHHPLRHELSGINEFLFAARIDFLGPTLSERIKGAKATASQVRLNDQPVIRVDFEDAWGINAVWFDPAHDHHPVRVTQQKLSRHLARPNVRMDQLPPNSRYGRLTEINREFSITRFQKVGGEWFADGFEARNKSQSSESKSAEDKVVGQISGLSRDPRARGNEFKIQTAVPDGTKVLIGDEWPSPYEWRDGKVVKKIGRN